MNYLNQFLEFLGIHANLSEDSSPILLLLSCIFILSVIAMLSFINILIYLGVLYITEHKLFLDKISKYSLLTKLLSIYRKTRMSFLIFEILLLLTNLSSVIWLCYRVIITIS